MAEDWHALVPRTDHSWFHVDAETGLRTPLQDEDWNGRWQAAMALPESTDRDRLAKYSALVAVNRDFVTAATSYAKTIIAELFLPNDRKSIRPRRLGGIAGGTKFEWRGVLFKVADGYSGPYNGSDECAAKSLGHDLRGSNQLLACAVQGLNVSLQAVSV